VQLDGYARGTAWGRRRRTIGYSAPDPRTIASDARHNKDAPIAKCIDCGMPMYVARPSGMCRRCERELEEA